MFVFDDKEISSIEELEDSIKDLPEEVKERLRTMFNG